MELEKVLSTESVMVLTFLLGPGWVYGRVKAWTTQRETSVSESLASIIYINLVRSVVLLGLTSIVFGLTQVDGLVEAVNKGDPTWMFQSRQFALLTGVELVAWPVIAGLIMGVLELTDVLLWVRSKIGLPAIAFDQAWDAAFAHIAQIDKDVVVLIEFSLKKPDARKRAVIYGQFDAHSAASKTGPYYDVFCSDEWVPTPDGDSLIPSGSAGLVVRGAEYGAVRMLLIGQDGSILTFNELGAKPKAH